MIKRFRDMQFIASPLYILGLVSFISSSATLPQNVDSHLLLDSYDICKDPLQVGTRLGYNVEDVDNVAEVVNDTITEMVEFNTKLRRAIRKFESRYIPCRRVRDRLQELDITDLVRISHEYDIQGKFKRIYRNIAEIQYLFNILNSDGAGECCFKYSKLFNQLKNKISTKWFKLASLGVNEESFSPKYCIVSGHLRERGPIDCDDTRDLIYTVLRHGLQKLTESINHAKRRC